MRKTDRKLSLSLETIRNLADRELTAAAGGYLYSAPPVCNTLPPFTTLCTQYPGCVPWTTIC